MSEEAEIIESAVLAQTLESPINHAEPVGLSAAPKAEDEVPADDEVPVEA